MSGNKDKTIEEQNIFSFDGLYNNCYIRLEADDIKDIKKALNEIFK